MLMLLNIGALTHKNVGQPPEGLCGPGVPNRPCVILTDHDYRLTHATRKT